MTMRQTITASLVAITALIYSLLIEPQWIEVTRHSKDIRLGAGEITIARYQTCTRPAWAEPRKTP